MFDYFFFPCNTTIDFYNATENFYPSCKCWALSQDSFFFLKKVCLDAEQQAVQLACSRLQELSCKWNGCSVKMNSVDALIRHLNRQHKSPTSHSNVCLSLPNSDLRPDLTAIVLSL